MTANAEGTTMLKHLAYITVFVSDQDRALDFYTNVLGLEQRIDNPTPEGARFLGVAVKGEDLLLVLWPGTPGQAQPAKGPIPFAAYTFETGDCRKAFDALKSRGVKFETEVLETPWADVAVFVDPDGNRLQLREGRQSRSNRSG
jgi:catechol 2,3-dioxygenase-like lactoylglutathione lyase family enzyme